MLWLGQFLNRFYKRWGKAFIMGAKEAIRSRKVRLALNHAAKSRGGHASSRHQLVPSFKFAPPGSSLYARGFAHGSSASSPPVGPIQSGGGAGALVSPVRAARRFSSGSSSYMSASSSPPLQRLFDREGGSDLADVSLPAAHTGIPHPGTGASGDVKTKASSVFRSRISLHSKTRVSRHATSSSSSMMSAGSEHGRKGYKDLIVQGVSRSARDGLSGGTTRSDGGAPEVNTSEDGGFEGPWSTRRTVTGLRHRTNDTSSSSFVARSERNGPRGSRSASSSRPALLTQGRHSGRVPRHGRLRVHWSRVFAALSLTCSIFMAIAAWFAGYRYVPSRLEGIGWAETLPGIVVNTIVARVLPFGRIGQGPRHLGSMRDILGKVGSGVGELDSVPPGSEAEIAAAAAAADLMGPA